eukprot:SAG31_NODE_2049_length_6564_cov_13.995824_2_plen_70_part_00
MERRGNRVVVKLDNLRDFDSFDLHDHVRNSPAKAIPAMEKALNELVCQPNCRVLLAPTDLHAASHHSRY